MPSYSPATLDPYVELGVARDASQQVIKQAYRRIALETHPDRNSKDAATVERFRRASQSYALLRDEERRRQYDRTGRWDDAGWSPSELDTQLAEALEIFAHDFGAAVDIAVMEDRAPAHTGRVTMPVDVSYEEVERGGRRRIPAPCAYCAGSGAREGSTQVRCTSCGGSGRLRHVESSLLGPRIHTETCESCHGSGRRPLLVCPGCDGSGRSPGGEVIDVVIPRGIGEGDLLDTMNGNGSRFAARLLEDQRWGRDGADLYATGRIPYAVAVLGGLVDIELPGRTHRAAVAAGTPSGHRVRIAGQGLPQRDGSGRGNLFLTLHVAVPERVSPAERFLLMARRGRLAAQSGSGMAARVWRLQTHAREMAGRKWREWRAHHHQSSLLRIERAAASLRSAAGLVSESEQRLGPALERGFRMIAPEAAEARSRIAAGQLRYGALAELVVDSILVTGLAIGLWLVGRYAGPALGAAGGDAGWDLLRKTHPAAFALVPLLAGVGVGVLRNTQARRRVTRFVALPLGIAVGAAAAATGAAMYMTSMRMAPDGDFILRVAMSLVAAFAIGIAPIFLFLLGDSLVDSARAAVQESSERADRLTLRKYDVAAARLATHLEGTERAFRELLTQADDARRPLTSLLNGAADTLAVDRHRLPRSTAIRAALALVASIAVTFVWMVAASVVASSAFVHVANAETWLRLLAAAVAAGLCGLGAILPTALLERQRTSSIATVAAVVVAVLALVGILTTSPGGVAAGWLAAGCATAALALSFRLREAARATIMAAAIVAAGLVAIILWPFAFVHAALRGGAAETA